MNLFVFKTVHLLAENESDKKRQINRMLPILACKTVYPPKFKTLGLLGKNNNIQLLCTILPRNQLFVIVFSWKLQINNNSIGFKGLRKVWKLLRLLQWKTFHTLPHRIFCQQITIVFQAKSGRPKQQ